MEPEAIKAVIRDQFASLLTQFGTNATEPDLFRTWQAFKAFAHTRVEQTHGFLLFECGLANFGEGEYFNVHLLRNFYLEVEENWDDLMVEASFDFVPVPELNQFEISISLDAGTTPEPDVFINQVESHQELWQVLEKYPVRQCYVYMGSQ